jgi:hypothetical protein
MHDITTGLTRNYTPVPIGHAAVVPDIQDVLRCGTVNPDLTLPNRVYDCDVCWSLTGT